MIRRLLTATLALATAATLAGCLPEPVDLPEPRIYEDQILHAINELRASEDVPTLRHNECIADQARERAALLPGVEEVPRDDLDASCTDHPYAGETIARTELTPVEVVETWEGISTQYPNLVDPGFTEAGVGCVGVAFDDKERAAEPGEEIAGMACSVLYQGPGQ